MADKPERAAKALIKSIDLESKGKYKRAAKQKIKHERLTTIPKWQGSASMNLGSKEIVSPGIFKSNDALNR